MTSALLGTGRAFAKDPWLIVFYALSCMGLGVWLGQDLNWDLLNYHFYNPSMLVDGRLTRDVHVAGLQTFLNPALDLPLYAAFRLGVPPPMFFLGLSAFHGLALWGVHRCVELVLPPAVSPAWAFGLGLVAATTAAFGAAFHSEIGNTMGDNTLAVLIVIGLWLVLRQVRLANPLPRSTVLASGALAGLAVGAKLTSAPMAIGLGALMLALPIRPALRVRAAIVYSIGVALGALASSGYWMWLMWHHFESPLFPWFNATFNSPFAPTTNFRADWAHPQSTVQALFYPFYWLQSQRLVTEVNFRDGRFATAFLALGTLAIGAVILRFRSRHWRADDATARLWLIAVFWTVSYVIWLRIFSYYRYAVVLELLAPVLLIGVAALGVQRPILRWVLIVGACAVLVVTTIAPNWGRHEWSDSYFGVDHAQLARYEHSTIVTWDFPQGFLVPFFPESATFVRVWSNWGLEKGTLMWERVEERLEAGTEGRMFILDVPSGGSFHDQQGALLGSLGLATDHANCQLASAHSGPFRICPIIRTRP